MTTATISKFQTRVANMLGKRDYRNFATLQRAYNKRYGSDNVTLPTFIARAKSAGLTTRVVGVR